MNPRQHHCRAAQCQQMSPKLDMLIRLRALKTTAPVGRRPTGGLKQSGIGSLVFAAAHLEEVNTRARSAPTQSSNGADYMGRMIEQADAQCKIHAAFMGGFEPTADVWAPDGI